MTLAVAEALNPNKPDQTVISVGETACGIFDKINAMDFLESIRG